MTASKGSQLHLITLGVSHYCEKARWALERSTFSFKETAHFPGFHSYYAKKLGGGTTSLPKLVIVDGGEKRVLHDSSDILAYSDSLISNEKEWLYPPDMKETVRSWEEEFDKVLGPHIRIWAYCYLLYHKGIFTLLSQRVSVLEKVGGFLVLPVLRPRLGKLVGCNEPGAKESSWSKIVSIFDKVDAALADGRPFICGERFTAADLTFAALAGPAVLPRRYGAYLPCIEEVPPEMAEKMRILQESLAGKHIMKLYETERYRSGT